MPAASPIAAAMEIRWTYDRCQGRQAQLLSDAKGFGRLERAQSCRKIELTQHEQQRRTIPLWPRAPVGPRRGSSAAAFYRPADVLSSSQEKVLIPSTVPIFMLIVRLLLLTAGTLDALSARSWLSGGVKPNPFIDGGIEPQAATLQLGMMPFALDDAMLPGEKRTISLSDKMLIQLIKEAPHDCIGQLLLNSNDDVAPISPLLQVEKMDFMGTSKATCLLYTSPSPRDRQKSRMPSSA